MPRGGGGGVAGMFHLPLLYFALLADDEGAKSVSSGLLLYFCLPPLTRSGLTPVHDGKSHDNSIQLTNWIL